MLKFTATVAALALLAGPALAKAPKSQRCAAVTTAQVEALFTQFNAAWATKDPAKVTALFSPDAVLLATVSNTPRTNLTEIQDYFVGFLKSAPVGTIDSSTIKIGCNTVSRLGTWTVRLTDAATGAVTNVKARYSFIYSLENGVWKIEHLHSSMMPEKAA
jgi:uncharacterized protein (TIGR02246 family)